MENSTYNIRYEACIEHFNDDGDSLRLKRELMALEKDIGRAVKRARLSDEVSTVVLIELLDEVWCKIDNI